MGHALRDSCPIWARRPDTRLMPVLPFSWCFSGGAKGIRNPPLTRQNAGSLAVSLSLIPIRSRSLPAVLFSGLDSVKRAGG
jgi:hypothetical protein